MKFGNSSKKINLMGIDSSLWGDSDMRWRKGDIEGVIRMPREMSFFRLYFFYVLVFAVLLTFLARLFVLTIVDGSENRELAENNRVKLVEVEAERGKIIDRFGKPLSYSQTVYILKKGDMESELSSEDAGRMEASGLAGEYFEGVEGKIIKKVRRRSTLGEAASHVLGYTSVVQAEEKERDRITELTNARGRLGLEQMYNLFLSGTVGKRLIEVDAGGSSVSILGEQEMQAGRSIVTGLDGDLQKVVFEALSKYAQESGSFKGAAVVQNPTTGEILALASYPSFNPEDIGRSVTDKNNPFFNRALSGNYPPGSIFKVVTALAALESGTVKRDEEIEDVGQFEFGGERFSNWYYNQYGKTDGLVKMERAIARSNDTYFFRVGQKINLDTLRSVAIKLGFGQKTGIDLPDEAYGLVPDGVWKQSAVGDSWYTGDTMHLMIGQGFMLVTPLQINAATAYVASGLLTKPYIVSKIESGLGAGEISFEPKIVGENIIGEDSLKVVRQGMKKACEIGGTGAPFFRASYKVGCKTGTAEEAGGKPHAWFTIFAPFEKPQIAMTVIVERGGEGSAVAAPVAKEVVDWWFQNRQ